MKFINNIFIIIFYYNIFITSKIIFFDLEKKDEIIIKDIYIKKYNSYFNLALDTLGFISGLFVSKELRYDFVLGDIFSPVNSFRTFEGNKAEINIFENESNSNYEIAIFKKYKNYNFFDKNKTYDGIIGLALNYTSDIVIDECYFFGEDKKYSIMNYLIKELHLFEKNIFTIYKNKFILGDINNNNITHMFNKNIKYCKTRDKIEESFIYFFWNCDIENISIKNNNNKINIKISLLIDSLLKNYIISTSIKVTNIIINEINSELNSINTCKLNNNKIYCLTEYYNIIIKKNLNLILNNETNIEINEFNIDKHQNILKIGKALFDFYSVIFDGENRRIGFLKIKNNDKDLILDKKYYYTNIFPYKIKSELDANKIIIIKLLFFIVILISFIGIIFLLFGKNNYYHYE